MLVENDQIDYRFLTIINNTIQIHLVVTMEKNLVILLKNNYSVEEVL
ncbi:unnamed protein product [Meloidogyne enterolobii]|uniref:Uncharacterized protein n=1 Tax=Meloidogyne enterolobii TaxID=390850 RepID=A0ACB0YS97_MELEN